MLLSSSFVFTFMLLLLPTQQEQQLQEEEEAKLLLSFKEQISDPLGHLEDWSPSISHCSWRGVSCAASSSSSGSYLTVTGLELESKNLSGTIASSTICKLPNLTFLSLSDNNFTTPFPAHLLLQCKTLLTLDLSFNLFYGPLLPNNFSSSSSSLQHLDISYNVLSGAIPTNIQMLSNLQVFNAWACLFTSISPHLANLTNLTNLTLSYNPFTPAPLPTSLHRLAPSLKSLKCGGCQLTGPIPDWIADFHNLDFLELTWNSLSGQIPPKLMYLPKLRCLELYSNKLTGPIPSTISNLRSLTDLDLNSNFLDGSIPESLADIPNLGLIHLWNNSLTGSIPDGLSRLKNLYDLSLFMNNLTGTLPADLGSFSPLEIFDVSTNSLTGPLPVGLCNAGRLRKLILFTNYFTQSFPQSYAQCSTLIRMRVFDNNFSGPIPTGIWGLPEISIFEIYGNSFQGNIPPHLGNASRLQTLRIHNNLLSGVIPAEISKLKLLDELSASANNLSGPLPKFDGCSALNRLYLASNSINGSIPQEMGSLSNLAYLDLSHNRISGSIPPTLGNLKSLISLDLSKNRICGKIPPELASLRLREFILFNVSYNDLSGTLPAGMDIVMLNLSLVGNPKLDIPSSSQTSKPTRRSNFKAWIAGLVLALAAAASALCSYCLYKTCHGFSIPDEKNTTSGQPWTMTAFHKIEFTLDDVLDCLDEDNVIGSGGSGKVYKVPDKNIAVKKLWSFKGELNSKNCSDDDGFKAEVEILGRIRHLNIVKLLCCCSNGQVNLLVYEYLPYGSLGDVLHAKKGDKTSSRVILDWFTRHKIALGAAQGLAYLHHDCVPKILHRDVKSNNILLTDEFDALLADFGLAKPVDNLSLAAAEYSISVLAGSHGYIAPEYAHRMKVNEKSDVYSFGVVLLELITGKQPVGRHEYGDDTVDLVAWVCTKIHLDGAASVLDPRLTHRDMVPVMKIALCCTNAIPTRRPSMRDVVQMLREAAPERPKL